MTRQRRRRPALETKYSQRRVESAVTSHLVLLSVVGTLGVIGWLSAIRTVKLAIGGPGGGRGWPAGDAVIGRKQLVTGTSAGCSG
jgi:hypothetical protein